MKHTQVALWAILSIAAIWAAVSYQRGHPSPETVCHASTSQHVPLRIDGLQDISSMGALDVFSIFALTEDRKVMTWAPGDNCHPPIEKTLVPDAKVSEASMFASGYHQRMVLAPDGSVWGMVDVGAQYFHQLGSGQSGEVKVVGLHDIASVVSGGNHSLALQSEGTVWAWGANDCGQSARSSDPRMPDTAPAAQVLLPGRAVAVAAGYRHSLSLLGDGSVWQWGNLTNPMFHANVGNQPVASFRYCGELQLPQATQALGDAHSSPIQVPGLHDIKAIATRYTHNLALAQDGSVWGWGFNDCGQAGPGRPSPVDGTTPPERIPGLADAVAIAAGRRHSLALTADGSVWTWGNNDQDQLGRDSAGLSFDERCMTRTRAPLRSAFSITPHRVAGLPPIKAIAAGDNLSLALDRQGHIWYWGQLP